MDDVEFEDKIHRTDTCWIWLGSKDKDGYGVLQVQRKHYMAHRYSYEFYVGPIPTDSVIDHVKANGCSRLDCVNPSHLEAVTPEENEQRQTHRNQYQNATHCINGHLFDFSNTHYTSDGRRQCRICRRERMRRYNERQRGTK